MSLERRRQMIEPEHLQLSVVRQCELVSISRSGSTTGLPARRR
jgi:putative transposase